MPPRPRANRRQLASTLAGFEACSTPYVLQVDADAMIGRRDRDHDYLADMLAAVQSDPDGLDPEDDLAFGTATRSRLKTMSEIAQHADLDRIGIPPMDDPPWLLTPADIDSLKGSGWIVASHGPYHENLAERGRLRRELTNLADRIEERSHMPWLCWPEGEWSPGTCADARCAGFHHQFGLGSRSGESPPDGLVLREVWWPAGFKPSRRLFNTVGFSS